MWGGLQPARDFSPAGPARTKLWQGGLKSAQLKPAPHATTCLLMTPMQIDFGKDSERVIGIDLGTT